MVDPSMTDTISIIAVTGLAAHAFGSWAHSARNMWLRDYLPRDISNARVLIYGYPSQLHGNNSRSILSDHSTNMIHRLLNMREMAKVCVFVSPYHCRVDREIEVPRSTYCFYWP